MPNNNLTDAEIIKALECCGKNHILGKMSECKDCYLRNNNLCITELIYLSLDLINRQKAEIERLNKEVDRLSQVVLYNDGVTEMKVEEAKAEAYKEFWNGRPERLNEKCKGREEYNKGWNACLDEFWEIRNNLLKELIGE